MDNVWLYIQFVQFGALAFGGGFTILPLLFSTFVTESGLFTAAEFGNLVSIAQMTPGPVTINIATFAGYLKGGIWSAIVASLGLVTPSFILTGGALFVLNRYQDAWPVQGFLKGARLVAFVMIVYAVVLFCNMSIFSEPWPVRQVWESIVSGRLIVPSGFRVRFLELGVMAVSFILMCYRVSVPMILIGAAVLGYLVSVFG